MQGFRILICCPNGAGISLMLQSMTAQAAQKLGLPLQTLHHGSIREGIKTGSSFDLVLCPRELAGRLDHLDPHTTVIGMNNPLSRRELEELLAEFLRQHRPEG